MKIGTTRIERMEIFEITPDWYLAIIAVISRRSWCSYRVVVAGGELSRTDDTWTLRGARKILARHYETAAHKITALEKGAHRGTS